MAKVWIWISVVLMVSAALIAGLNGNLATATYLLSMAVKTIGEQAQRNAVPSDKHGRQATPRSPAD